MRAPASGHPSNVERRSVAIARAVRVENRENVFESAFIFAENPISIFAHNGQSVQDDGLAAADDRPQRAFVERFRELQIDVH